MRPTSPFVFFDVRTADADGSKRFFAELLGWEANGPLLTSDGAPWGGLTELAPDDVRTPQWLPYAPVPDVDAAAAKAVALGGTLVRERTDLPVGSLVVVTDPGGAALVLFQAAETP
ncbi:glyoxalase [Amycolatopsis sp. FBCC-B4732]|uniref:VOC family protein n=1 Tax=Amycolatopsis sp. FBCC-B4732 TaxID=3079339 RepID=UPI001FF6F8B1|nr:VOC family protein [Amycolatopsis sp. FBCC-B4732]UOX86703.1 glyoxalase [Amycolatopsis sp. FBCC-B4732]